MPKNLILYKLDPVTSKFYVCKSLIEAQKFYLYKSLNKFIIGTYCLFKLFNVFSDDYETKKVTANLCSIWVSIKL